MAATRKSHVDGATTDGSVAIAVRSRGNRYSEEEKIAALEAVNLCGGNVTEAARLTGLERETIRQWSIGNGVSETAFAEFAAKKQGQLTAKLRALVTRLADALASEDKIESARYGELNAAFGTVFDKIRLIDDRPTAITENRNDAALREKAEAILAALLPEYEFDRALALAAMRESAPTLSEYVN